MLFSFSFSFYVISSQVGHLAEFWFVMRGATSQMERKEVKEVQGMTSKLVDCCHSWLQAGGRNLAEGQQECEDR